MADEEERIRRVYQKRDAEGKNNLYAWNQPDVLYSQFSFQRGMVRALTGSGITNLAELEILDVGCGSGAWLRTLADWRGSINGLHGIDLLEDRINLARELNPALDVTLGNGERLPFDDAQFDLVTAKVVFATILDDEIRRSVADDIGRVAKPDGRVVIFDFVVSNPRNPDVRKFGLGDVRKAFPEWHCDVYRLHLAPPIARIICRISPSIAHAMEVVLPFLRSHAIYVLRRQ